MPFLSPLEIHHLTGKKRRVDQVRILRFMGIEHKIGPDRSLLISRAHIEKTLDGDSVNIRTNESIQPDWSVLRAKAKSIICGQRKGLDLTLQQKLNNSLKHANMDAASAIPTDGLLAR